MTLLVSGHSRGKSNINNQPELALELVERARKMGLSFGCVDGLSGNYPEVLISFDALNEIYFGRAQGSIDLFKRFGASVTDQFKLTRTQTQPIQER